MQKGIIHQVILICGLFMLMACGPTYAEDGDAPAAIGEAETEYPTVAALNAADVPFRDRVDLGRRLLGVTDIPAPLVNAPQRQVGDVQLFWANNSDINRVFQVEAELMAVGDHVYVWVDVNANVARAEAEQFARGFDRDVYEPTRALWGSEASPGIDGDPRVYALFALNLSPSASAYFSSQHTYPSVIAPNSNEHEMMFFNLSNIGPNLSAWYVLSIAAHEFQHMIRHNVDFNDSSWMDEGFATFTQQYLQFESEDVTAQSFLNEPQTQVNDWRSEVGTAPHYGASLLFVTYFYERYGLDGLSRLSSEQSDGLASVDKVLRELGASGLDDFFADWIVANALVGYDINDARYHYTLLSDNLRGARPLTTVSSYPYLHSGLSNQYAAHYFVLGDLEGAQAVNINLAVPDHVNFVQASAANGKRFWHSNKADNSDTTLTRAFDLSGVGSATLTYEVWHDTEDLWDYGYVMASTDSGATWDVLSTAAMTDENPNSTGYGPGYTGESGGWLSERIGLDAYAGQHILVRFEMITDDAITRPGMAIDDVAIPEIGYQANFEDDDGGWEAAGWILTDNRLPQKAWAQVIQLRDGAVTLARWLAPNEGNHRVELMAGAERVILVISPFAPLTTVDMPYTLVVSAE